jgi:methyl-accepting chemotaxis protein
MRILEDELKQEKSAKQSLQTVQEINVLFEKFTGPFDSLGIVGERGMASAEKYSEMAMILADQAKKLDQVICRFKLD